MNKNNKIILCSTIGIILEWYDFFLFGSLSAIMAKKFFSGNDIHSLVNTFGIFAIGYLARPIGSIFWGHLGDTIGRKTTLIYSIKIMTISTMAIGFLPSYTTIGVYAPILLIIFRIMQGFSISGEHTGCLLLISESIKNRNNDFYTSLSLSSVYLGILMANLVSFSLEEFLGQEAFIDWGWRIAFIFSAFLGVIGFYIRNNLDEPLLFTDMLKRNERIKIPFLYLIKNNAKTILLGIGVFQLAISIPYVIFIFLPSYLNGNLSSSANIVSLILTSSLILIFSTASNSKTRTKRLISIAILIAIFSLPILNYFDDQPFPEPFFMQLIFSIFCAVYVASIGGYMINLFPTNIRYSGISICFNIAAILFGGGTPLILSIFTYNTNNINYVAYFLILSAVIAISSLLIRVDYEENARY